MKFALTSSEVRRIEQETIEHYGIDALLLMEHAALSLIQQVKKRLENQNGSILCVCGTGNNGGDGIAAARLLACQGYNVKILMIGNMPPGSIQDGSMQDNAITKDVTLDNIMPVIGSDKAQELNISRINMPQKLNISQYDMPQKLILRQLDMALKLNISILYEFPEEEYDVIVDALFGIGFHGSAEGIYKEAVQFINKSASYVISADIPSGISADTGSREGEAVMADMTVTFGLCKIGLLLYPGAEHAGEVVIADIGFPKKAVLSVCGSNSYKYYEKCDIQNLLPKRTAYSNKGSYGRVLVVAGSADCKGAAYLAASAAYHMGAGLVKVLSVKEVTDLINIRLPEALTSYYDISDYEEKTAEALSWADSVIAGPGLGTGSWIQGNQIQGNISNGSLPEKIVDIIIRTCNKPLVLDADALNILAGRLNTEGIIGSRRMRRLSEMLPHGTVLTPHLKELSRLYGLDIDKICANLIDIAAECTYNNELIYILKDARTIISSKDMKYINISGNNGMATGGSGDVLAGMTAGLLAQRMKPEHAASLSAYLHGLAGDAAAEAKGVYYILAGDIIEALSKRY